MNKRPERTDIGVRASIERLLAFTDSVDRVSQDVPARELRPGDMLGDRFRIVTKLGAGGISTVYLAEDRYLGEVALKAPRLTLRNDRQAVQRFAHEIRVARSIRHPNICPVFDLFAFDLPSGPQVAATMEYIPGETLASRLARGIIPTTEAIVIAAGIAAGIDALHQQGIVHRDLKPGNILLKAADTSVMPILIDFGISARTPCSQQECGSDTQVRGIVGSPDYMAPEQFRGPSMTRAADIYAFGLILFEMATGKRPFPTEDLLPAAVRRATEDAPELCAVTASAPRAWAGAIARALARDPASRPAAAMEIVREMQTESSAFETNTAAVRVRRWQRRCR